MKINYIKENYFKPIEKHSPRTKEDVMMRVASVAKREEEKKKIKELKKYSVNLEQAIYKLLYNITNELKNNSSILHEELKDFKVNKDITLDPRKHGYKSIKEFCKNNFKFLGTTMPSYDNLYPYILFSTAAWVNLNFFDTYIVFNETCIVLSNFDLRIFIEWYRTFKRKYHKDFIHDDISEIPKNDAILQMMNGHGSTIIRNILKNNKDIHIEDLKNISFTWDYVKRIILTDKHMKMLKKDITFLEKYISECIGCKIKISMLFAPTTLGNIYPTGSFKEIQII